MYKIKFYKKDKRTGRKFRESYDSRNPGDRATSRIRFFPYSDFLTRMFKNVMKNKFGHRPTGLFRADYYFEAKSEEERQDIENRYKKDISVNVPFIMYLFENMDIGFGIYRQSGITPRMGLAFGDDEKIFNVIPCESKLGFKIKGITNGINSLDNILEWDDLDKYIIDRK